MADTFLTNMAVADAAIMDQLGETVSVKDAAAVSKGTVVGVFEHKFVESGNAQGYAPTFTYRVADLAIGEGYEITRDAVLYNVRVVQPDGTGVALLILGEK